MIFLGAIKQAALEKESSAYCLRYEKQLLCVWGDSKAWKNKNSPKKIKRFNPLDKSPWNEEWWLKETINEHGTK